MIDDRLRSPLARAVVPVLGGIAFIGVLGLVLWGVSVLLVRNADPSDVHLGTNEFVLQRLDKKAELIAKEGPLLLPGLVGPAERLPIGIWHDGDVTTSGWQVFSLVPAGETPSCVLQLDRTDRTSLVDPCTQTRYPADGSTLPHVNSHVDLDGNLVINFAAAAPTTAPG